MHVKKHNMKLGLYYSHWVDWEHTDGWDHTREIYNITPEEYDGYWQEKVVSPAQGVAYYLRENRYDLV